MLNVQVDVDITPELQKIFDKFREENDGLRRQVAACEETSSALVSRVQRLESRCNRRQGRVERLEQQLTNLRLSIEQRDPLPELAGREPPTIFGQEIPSERLEAVASALRDPGAMSRGAADFAADWLERLARVGRN
jgi:hypothetical protein